MRLTVIGGGPEGYTAAFAAAEAGAEVTLFERAHLGGTGLHTGCIPTKTLRSPADALETAAQAFGIAGELSRTVSRVVPCEGGATIETAPFPAGTGDARVLSASAVCVNPAAPARCGEQPEAS